MTTLSEVYFLVRVGSWDENDLDSWCQGLVEVASDQEYQRGYELGHESGFTAGQEEMLASAKDAVNRLG